MHRPAFLLTALLVASAALTAADDAFDARFRLTGWAAIPSTYRHPGPVSGQFTTGPVNGVTPPYQGQPIPGFSGIIPGGRKGTLIGLPDNGFGAQTNSADFVIGFYEFAADFKTKGDGTSSRGPGDGERHSRRSAIRKACSTCSYITGGPVYLRQNYYPTGTADSGGPGDPEQPSADRRRLRRRVDRRAWMTERSGLARSSGPTCSTSMPRAG